MVELDEKSLASEGQRPWTRDRLATLVGNLFDRYHARVLGFDIAFAEADDKAARLWQSLASGELADLPGIAERRATIDRAVDYDARFAQALHGRPVVQIGRAHVCTPVTNAHLVCRLLLEKKKKKTSNH